MEGLEEKLQAVLQDPQQMQEIFAMARSLGLDLPQGGDEASDATQQRQMPDQPPAQNAMLSLPVGQLLQQAGKLEPKQENLLNAIKPFLKPGRREKIDRAMQVARLSHLAGYALRSRGEQEQP